MYAGQFNRSYNFTVLLGDTEYLHQSVSNKITIQVPQELSVCCTLNTPEWNLQESLLWNFFECLCSLLQSVEHFCPAHFLFPVRSNRSWSEKSRSQWGAFSSETQTLLRYVCVCLIYGSLAPHLPGYYGYLQKLQVAISDAQISQQQHRMVRQKSQRFLKLSKQWRHFLWAHPLPVQGALCVSMFVCLLVVVSVVHSSSCNSLLFHSIIFRFGGWSCPKNQSSSMIWSSFWVPLSGAVIML